MENNTQLDMLICIIPKINPDAPTVGPAVLKSHLLSAGFSCEVMDLNVQLFNEFKKHGDEKYFFEKDKVFKANIDDGETQFDQLYEKYEYVFLEWIKQFIEKNPKFLGMSLLSSYSRAVALNLSILIRKHLPNTKIVWGGAEVSERTARYKDNGWIDHYIAGDGEFTIIELLKGNMNMPGIDGPPVQVEDLNMVEIPNYDDIDWSVYHKLKFDRPVYITGSRGCVKRCTFCNVYEIWPQYKFRSGEHIAKEIITVKEKYDRGTFRFTDSLINGSMKAFRNLLTELSEYRREVNSDFKWVSQWIIRPKNQSPESDYKLMKDAGCEELEIGLESFSQDVRFHLGKKFTNEDMWHCLDMLQQYEIPCTLMMIVGYPTETEEDHQHTLDTVQKLFDLGYATRRTSTDVPLIWFSFSNTLMLDPTQPLWNLVKDELKNYKSELEWDYRDNTLEVRLKRFKEVNELIKNLSGRESTWMFKKSLEKHITATGDTDGIN